MFYYKLGQLSAITKWGRRYYKLGQTLLQIRAAITNWGNYYILGHNSIWFGFVVFIFGFFSSSANLICGRVWKVRQIQNARMRFRRPLYAILVFYHLQLERSTIKNGDQVCLFITVLTIVMLFCFY